MYTNRILLVFLILSFNVKAQRMQQLDAEIILTSNDTLRSKIDVYGNLFQKDLLNELSVNRVIRTKVSDSKIKLFPNDVKQLKFVDFRNKTRVFISKNDSFQEQMFLGKIKWYREYRQNSYDGSIVIIDYMKNERNEEISIGLFNNRRKKIKDITNSKPELIPFIDEMTVNDESYYSVLKRYEDK